MMGVLFCCGAGFFIRRRMYPSPLRDEPAFNVSFTRHPVTTPGTAPSFDHADTFPQDLKLRGGRNNWLSLIKDAIFYDLGSYQSKIHQ